jgi:hypothetical protein
MAMKFATKEQRDEFLRRQYEPAKEVTPTPQSEPTNADQDNR